MSFSVQQTGFKSVRLALLRLRAESPSALKNIKNEANARHAETYRRRSIPVDTGRLKRSLTLENPPMTGDREVVLSKSGLKISCYVPYAKYQKYRISNLTRHELKYVFVEPVLEELREFLQAKRTKKSKR